MKRNKIFCTLALAIILSLLIVALPTVPTHAVTGWEDIGIYPTDGEIGDRIYIDGYDFEPGDDVYIYFSSDSIGVGYRINDLDAYEKVRSGVSPDYDGYFETYFIVPDELTKGDDSPEDVRGGDYYVYVSYLYSTVGEIVARATFAIISGEITIDPEEGNVGDEVEISGEGFGDRESITVEYDGDEIDIESGDDETDRYGDFTCTILIPESTGGDHTITVIDDSRIEAEAEFTVEPTMTISSTSGSIGDTVSVSGTGFGYRKYVTIYFGGDEVDTSPLSVRTTTDGSFEATFAVPALASGVYDVEVEDTVDNSDTAEFTIVIVVAYASITPTIGSVDTEVEVSGTGFIAGSTVTIKYDALEIDTATVDSNGEFTCLIFIPESVVGDHTITVTDGIEAEAEFTVEPEITISPTSGSIGDIVSISGTGFGYRKYVTIYFGGDEVDTSPSSVRTTTDGSFDATFAVPGMASDDYNVDAEDADNNIDTAQFTVAALLSLIPATSLGSPGHVGMELTMSGTGFIANQQVTITYLSEPSTFTTNTDANGTFSYKFDAPASASGAHTITATDGINTLSKTFYMESAPPSTVYPLLPRMDGKLETGKFDWCGDATDPSKEVTDDSLPVTYTLEIATDGNFTNIVLKKEGLTTSEYTLTEAEKQLLPSTKKEAPYCWHVRAIDSAFNDAGWTGTGRFHVGFTLEVPEWANYALFGILALLLGIFGFWVGRRTAYSSF